MEPKSGRVGHPLQVMAKYILIYFDLFQEKLDDHQPNRKQKYFCGGLIFQGLRLSLRHFGQQAHESLCQLQNGVTSSLPPFIVDLLTFKDYPRSNSFFRCASIS